MTINELIDTLKAKRELFGGDCEVSGWGDEGGAMGLKLLEVTGYATAKELENDDAAYTKWRKLRKQFKADCSMRKGDEVIFLREIRDDAASWSL